MLTYKDLLLTGPEAVCVLDSELEIKQHNRLLSLLLGYRGGELTGRHLSSILDDDALIRYLLSSDSSSGWTQGECTLKMGTERPLVVKFRAGPVIDEDLFPTHHEMTDIIYYPAESRFLPQSSALSSGAKGLAASVAEQSGYVLVFREVEDTRYTHYERQVNSLQFLLKAISERDMEVTDILAEFAKIIDPYAETMLLPPDIGSSDTDDQQILPPAALEAALLISRAGNAVSYRTEDAWSFFSVCSPIRIHGIACIKSTIPRLYNETDKQILVLAGKVMGIYMETCTSSGQAVSSQPLLEIVLNDIDQPVIVVDRRGYTALCNLAAEKTYGYTASQMIGRSFGELVFPADSNIQYEDLLTHVMRGETAHYEEMSHIRSDLSLVDVSLSAYPHKLDNGLIAGGIFIMRDLRDKRRLWEKMKQWEKLAALGEILSSVANELNNPLTSLTGYSHLLMNRNEDEEINDMVSTIHEEARRCSNIVHSVLGLARGDEEQKEHFHVNDIIIATLNLKRRQLRPNNIDVCMSLGEGIPNILADPHDIERLFLRLINYAEKRMVEYDNGGRLAVESVFEDGKIIVRFKDTGTCILEDDVAEITDPFFTGNADEGIELGLSISCRILRNIGGSIRVDNEIGKGNIFTVEIPAVIDFVSSSGEHKMELPAFSLEAGKRILVVDDEPAIVELLAEILQQMGHLVDIAGDGNEAMNKLESGTYDLIISDLRMPSGFTGDKLYKFIELRDPDLARRMIFITGDVINPETRNFLQSTGNLYLEKPFLPESLRAAIETSLSKQESE